MGWTSCRRGHAHWGRRGAAGLLLAADDTVLLQLRSAFVHRGGTWAVPGGAIERGESEVDAARRGAREECGLAAEHYDVGAQHRADCGGGWVYTTVVARLRGPVAALELRGNLESRELRWVALFDVAGLDLLPAFRTAWPQLRALVAAG